MNERENGEGEIEWFTPSGLTSTSSLTLTPTLGQTITPSFTPTLTTSFTPSLTPSLTPISPPLSSLSPLPIPPPTPTSKLTITPTNTIVGSSRTITSDRRHSLAVINNKQINTSTSSSTSVYTSKTSSTSTSAPSSYSSTLPKLKTNLPNHIHASDLTPKLNSILSPSPSTTSINTTFASSDNTDSHLLHQKSYISLKQTQQRYLALSPIQLGGDSSSSSSSSSPSTSSPNEYLTLAPSANPMTYGSYSVISGGSPNSPRSPNPTLLNSSVNSTPNSTPNLNVHPTAKNPTPNSNSNPNPNLSPFPSHPSYQPPHSTAYRRSSTPNITPSLPCRNPTHTHHTRRTASISGLPDKSTKQSYRVINPNQSHTHNGNLFNSNYTLNQRRSLLRKELQDSDIDEVTGVGDHNSTIQAKQPHTHPIDPHTSLRPTSINWSEFNPSFNTSYQHQLQHHTPHQSNPSTSPDSDIYASDLEYSSTNSPIYSLTTSASRNVIDGNGDDSSNSRHRHFHHHHHIHTPSASVSSLRNMLSGHNLRGDRKRDKSAERQDNERRIEEPVDSSSTMLKQTLLRHHQPSSSNNSSNQSSNNSSASSSCPGSPSIQSVASTSTASTNTKTQHQQHHHHHPHLHLHTHSTSSLPAATSTISNSASSTLLVPSKPESVKETHHISIDYDPVSGRKKLNTYEIIRELGRGQHGKVKLGRKIETGEYVAIKVVDRVGRPRLGKLSRPGNTQEDKIRREIAILKKCHHPNIVRLLEVLDDSSSKKIYLVLEYLEKGEIEWQNEADGTPVMPRHLVKSTARDVLLGLEYLHFQGIIHRDIKPANLLLSRDGVVKISDFGVSYISDYSQDELELAKTAGTPAFFAPELCSEKNETRPPITHKIDIWALGVTLYCLLFGRVPFIADSEYELFSVILETPLIFPDENNDNDKQNHHGTLSPTKFDSDIELAKDLLRQMLNKDPTKRIDIQEIKQHPWICEGMEQKALEKFLHTCEFDNQRIEVTGEEVQEAVRGITGKIKRGLARLGTNALEFAGLRRKSSGSSISSSREPTPLGKERSDRTKKPSESPPQRTILLTSNTATTDTFPDDRRGSYASTLSISTNSTTAGTTPNEKLIPTRKSISSSQSNLNLNALLENEDFNNNLNLQQTISSSIIESSFSPIIIDNIEEDDSYSEGEDDDDDDDGELTLTVGPHRFNQSQSSRYRNSSISIGASKSNE